MQTVNSLNERICTLHRLVKDKGLLWIWCIYRYKRIHRTCWIIEGKNVKFAQQLDTQFVTLNVQKNAFIFRVLYNFQLTVILYYPTQ